MTTTPSHTPVGLRLQIDSQFFWAGVPWEFESRQFAALTLNTALKTSTYLPNNTVGLPPLFIHLSIHRGRKVELVKERSFLPLWQSNGSSCFVMPIPMPIHLTSPLSLSQCPIHWSLLSSLIMLRRFMQMRWRVRYLCTTDTGVQLFMGPIDLY